MKVLKAVLDPFALAGILVLLVTLYTYRYAFIARDFPTFTTEEEIDAAIEQEFPLFVDYL